MAVVETRETVHSINNDCLCLCFRSVENIQHKLGSIDEDKKLQEQQHSIETDNYQTANRLSFLISCA